MVQIEAWHRRHALNLTAQLPDKIEDARLVLQAMQELVETFLSDPPAPELRVANVVSLMPA